MVEAKFVHSYQVTLLCREETWENTLNFMQYIHTFFSATLSYFSLKQVIGKFWIDLRSSKIFVTFAM